jgi:hypothetical protein
LFVTPFFWCWAGPEELASLDDAEAEKARKKLDELRVAYDHLYDTASVAVTAVWLEPILLLD